MIDLAGFALAVLLIELTPGPNMAWLVTLTLAEGRRAGLGAITGIALGLAANALLSVLAARAILAQGPALTQGVAVLAAAMMAWLAWEAWSEAGESSPTATPRQSSQRHALAGFVINLINPCVDGPPLARGILYCAGWSWRPCVRPVCAALHGRWP